MLLCQTDGIDPTKRDFTQGLIVAKRPGLELSRQDQPN